MRAKRLAENVIHGWFLLMGLVTVGCVLLISVYLIVSDRKSVGRERVC